MPNETNSDNNKNLTTNNENKCYKIFLSYQWDSQIIVKEFYKELSKYAFLDLWLDSNRLLSEPDLNDGILNAIHTCSLMLVFMTKKFIKSENCIKEIVIAYHLNKPVIPIILEAIEFADVGISIFGGVVVDYSIFNLRNNMRINEKKLEELLKGIETILLEGPLFKYKTASISDDKFSKEKTKISMELIKYRGGDVLPSEAIMDEFKASSLRSFDSKFENKSEVIEEEAYPVDDFAQDEIAEEIKEEKEIKSSNMQAEVEEEEEIEEEIESEKNPDPEDFIKKNCNEKIIQLKSKKALNLKYKETKSGRKIDLFTNRQIFISSTLNKKSNSENQNSNLISYKNPNKMMISPLKNDHVLIGLLFENKQKRFEFYVWIFNTIDDKLLIEKKLHSDCSTVFLATNNQDLIIVSLVDMTNKQSLKLYNSDMNIVKENNLKFQVSNLFCNSNKIYLVSKQKQSFINIYDWNLSFVNAIGQSDAESSPYYFPSSDRVYNKNGIFFIIEKNNKIKLVSEQTGQLLKIIKLDTNDSELEIDQDLNFHLLNKSKRFYSIYDSKGRYVFEKNLNEIRSFDSRIVEPVSFCLNESGQLIINDDNNYLFIF